MKSHNINSGPKKVTSFNLKRVVCFALFGLAVVVTSTIFWHHNSTDDIFELDEDTVNSLSDISTLPESFMTSYFSEVSVTNNIYDTDQTIIVTSLTALENDFGADEIISAPNHQYFLYYNSKEARDQALARLDNEDSVLFAESDTVSEISAYNSWGIEDMGLDQAVAAIDLENANDVTVAIIDTGCDLDTFNESFNGRIEETYNLYDAYMHDDNGHGTHIAGTIAEGTPENVKIFPVKVSDSRSFRTSSIITAINYINYYHKADVINMSFGSSRNSKSEFVAIQAAADNGIISVAAAGNESSSANSSYPAAWSNTISVSAVNSDHELADFSNYGSSVTFTAPGVDIQSINGTMSGTSMATPHVVSAIAALKSVNKDLTLGQAVNILKDVAIDLGDEGRDDYYGYGLIDMSNFVAIAEAAKKTTAVDFEVTDTSKIDAGFGNITNLMNIPVLITNAIGASYEATLADLDGLEVSGYDAFAAGEQEIQLTWNNITKKVIVNNGRWGGNTYGFYTGKLNEQETVILNANNAPKKIYIPETINGRAVVAIGDGSEEFFYGSSGKAVEHIILPNTVREIRAKAFYQLDTLKSVTGGAEYISVGAQAFYDDYNLTVFEPKISEIGESAFYNTSLGQAVLADEITVIPNSAFQGCEHLATINLPSSLVEVGDYAFSETRLSSLNIPATLTTIGTGSFRDTFVLEHITVDDKNPVYDSRDSSNALIETATNTILLGSGNTIIPDTVVSIADYAFYGNQKIETLYTNNVEYLGQQAFYGCTSFHVLHIENAALVTTNMLTDRFAPGDSSGKYGDIPNLIIFDDVSTKYISIENTLTRQGVIAYIRTLAGHSVNVAADQEYVAFEQVKNLSVTAEYLSGFAGYPYLLNQEIDSYVIDYQNGDSFRAGDTYFTIRGVTQFGDPFEQVVNVEVAKATPTYTVPTDIVATYGQRIGDIPLPEGFSWNKQKMIIEMPTFAWAKFTPTDLDNYLIVEDISIPIQVSAKNDSLDYAGTYDGLAHTITPVFEPTTVTVKYSLDGVNYDLDDLPEFTDVGHYTVYYLVTEPDFVDLTGSNEVYIYGIEDFDDDVIVKDDNIIAEWGSSFASIASSVNVYADDASIEHRDADGHLVESDVAKTGDKIKITIGAYEREYTIVIRGDVDGNGEIGIIDYIRIKKDIMDTEKLFGIYYEAADVNNNNEIDIIDYIRIKKIIMEAES